MNSQAIIPAAPALSGMPSLLDSIAPAEAMSFGSTLASLSDQQPSALETKIHKAAQNYEGVFLGQMIAPMFDSVKTDGLFGGGHAEEIWRSFLVQEYGKSMAKRGGIGLAEQVENEMRAKSGLAPKPKHNPKYEVKA